MYLVGQGHEHLGPGTSMTQRINWTQDQELQLKDAFGRNLPEGLGLYQSNLRPRGKDCGMTGCGGLGLFETGLDFTSWSWPEYALVGLGLYVVASTVFTTGRAVRRVRALPGERRKARAAQLRREAAELTKRR